MKNDLRVKDTDHFYFMTLSITDMLHVFQSEEAKMMIVESLRFAQEKKDLRIAAWVIMINHLHLVASRGRGPKLSDIMRDFKRYTSRSIFYDLEEKNAADPFLHVFQNAAKASAKGKNIKVWKTGLHAKQIFSSSFGCRKLNYIHQNPVKAGLVDCSDEYRWSSAIDYEGGKGLLKITYPDWLYQLSGNY